MSTPDLPPYPTDRHERIRYCQEQAWHWMTQWERNSDIAFYGRVVQMYADVVSALRVDKP